MVDGRFDVEGKYPLRCAHSPSSFLRDVANDVTEFGMLPIPEAMSGFLEVDKCSLTGSHSAMVSVTTSGCTPSDDPLWLSAMD